MGCFLLVLLDPNQKVLKVLKKNGYINRLILAGFGWFWLIFARFLLGVGWFWLISVGFGQVGWFWSVWVGFCWFWLVLVGFGQVGLF